jgi:hypothetical protein
MNIIAVDGTYCQFKSSITNNQNLNKNNSSMDFKEVQARESLILNAKTCLSTCLYSITYNSCEYLQLEANTSNERLSFLNIFNEEYIINNMAKMLI